MSMVLSPHIRAVHFPPISEVKGWLAARPDTGLALIDLCQAVPDYAPAAELTAHLATVLDDPQTSKYSPDEGLAAAPEFIHQALKAQDTMAVCQPRITQQAVRFGLDHLDSWVAGNRDMMARRHDLFRAEFLRPGNPFQLAASGAFFAWVRHPFAGLTGRQAARRLVDEAAILCLPGEVFGPGLQDYLRLAFGNIREEAIPEAVRRFREIVV